tara:strand:+ start:118 stop:480 length:363 start_codon:yes stop_codon:yes gene_type:complete
MNKELREIFNVKNLNEFLSLPVERNKEIWVRYIISHKERIITEINKDIKDFNTGDNTSDKNSLHRYKKDEYLKILNFAKNNIKNFNVYNDIKKIKDNKSLLTYWPEIYLPYPNFVDEFYQ